ncbi:MAG TPA: hypothetical protein VIF63_08390 [Candidatus Limnocylindrales bacterium]|jgi:hypothetical protein
MEFFAGAGLVFVVVVLLMWRSRRGTTGRDSLTEGLANDHRDKYAGTNSQPEHTKSWRR